MEVQNYGGGGTHIQYMSSTTIDQIFIPSEIDDISDMQYTYTDTSNYRTLGLAKWSNDENSVANTIRAYDGYYNTSDFSTIPVSTTYTDYTVISDDLKKVLTNENLYLEFQMVSNNPYNTTGSTYDLVLPKSLVLLLYDRTSDKSYGVNLVSGFNEENKYAIFTISNGVYLNSVSIPYKANSEGYESSSYTDSTNKYRIGIGYDKATKKLFFHIEPNLYGTEYGLGIDNVELNTDSGFICLLNKAYSRTKPDSSTYTFNNYDFEVKWFTKDTGFLYTDTAAKYYPE